MTRSSYTKYVVTKYNNFWCSYKVQDFPIAQSRAGFLAMIVDPISNPDADGVLLIVDKIRIFLFMILPFRDFLSTNILQFLSPLSYFDIIHISLSSKV